MSPNWEHQIGVTKHLENTGGADRQDNSQAYETGHRNSIVQSTDTYQQNHIYDVNRGTDIQAYPSYKATLIILVTP